jgi:hypothetical protein
VDLLERPFGLAAQQHALFDVRTPWPSSRSTALRDSPCTARMSSAISLVEAPVRSARSLISSATTAKPLPCSPGLRGDDGGVERQQVRLLCHLVDDVDDVADLDRMRLAQLLDDRSRPRASCP